MNENRVISFYKKMGLYNEELFKKIDNCTTKIDSYNDLTKEFYGVFIKEDGSFKLILPKISSIIDEIIWVHEYAHAIFLDEDEIFPNIMESYYINMYADDKKEIIKKTEEEIEKSASNEHTIAKKIKLLNIK